jgi:hypothetical protein
VPQRASELIIGSLGGKNLKASQLGI